MMGFPVYMKDGELVYIAFYIHIYIYISVGKYKHSFIFWSHFLNCRWRDTIHITVSI